MITETSPLSMTLEELQEHCKVLERLVKQATLTFVRSRGKRDVRPAWVFVRDGFGVGSTHAARICERYEIDPEKGE